MIMRFFKLYKSLFPQKGKHLKKYKITVKMKKNGFCNIIGSSNTGNSALPNV